MPNLQSSRLLKFKKLFQAKERLRKYAKYKASSFKFNFYFSRTRLYWSDPWMDFDALWLTTHVVTRKIAFCGPHDGRQNFGVQIFQKETVEFGLL